MNLVLSASSFIEGFVVSTKLLPHYFPKILETFENFFRDVVIDVIMCVVIIICKVAFTTAELTGSIIAWSEWHL
jgi:hypothetical protein